MKTFSLILTLTLSHLLSNISPLELLDPHEARTDQMLQHILQFGADYVIQRGIQSGEFPDSEYEVFKIHDVQSEGLVYRFDVEMRNKVESIVRTSYVIDLEAWIDEQEIDSYEYSVEDIGAHEMSAEELEVEAEQFVYREIDFYWNTDVSELEGNNDIWTMLKLAVVHMAREEIEAEWLPSGEYDLEKLIDFYKETDVETNSVYYNFEVEVKNDLGWTLRSLFIFYDRPSLEVRELLAYDYSVVVPNDEESDFGQDVEANFRKEGKCSNIETISDEGLIDRLDDNGEQFIALGLVELKENHLLLKLLDFGVEYVVEKGIESDVLKGSDYGVYDVFEVESRKLNGMDYRYDVELRSSDGMMVRVIFVVYYQEWSHKAKVISYVFEEVEELV